MISLFVSLFSPTRLESRLEKTGEERLVLVHRTCCPFYTCSPSSLAARSWDIVIPVLDMIPGRRSGRIAALVKRRKVRKTEQ